MFPVDHVLGQADLQRVVCVWNADEVYLGQRMQSRKTTPPWGRMEVVFESEESLRPKRIHIPTEGLDFFPPHFFG